MSDKPISYKKIKLEMGDVVTIELPLRTVIYALAALMADSGEYSWTELRIMANGDGMKVTIERIIP
jgi:hypothetical protein